MRARPLSVLLPSVLSAGCSYPPPDFSSPDPGARLHAITQASRTSDQSSIPALISSLESDDPAVRMFAIRTLEKLTGQTLDYDYAAPEWERRPAVDRWIDWYSARENPAPPLP